MIGATLTTRLAQHGITKSAVTAFALFFAYNFKFLWAPIVDHVRLPVIGRFGQRRSWLVRGRAGHGGGFVPRLRRPASELYLVAIAAIMVGVAGATFDIIIDAYRIELRAAPARRRFRHVAVRLAHRLRRRGRARAGARRARRLERGLRRVRAVRAARDADRRADGRAAAPPRAGARPRVGRSGRCLLQPARGVPAAPGRARRARVRAHPQDRRHARQPDAAALVPGPRLHQRRSRLLRHRHRFCGASSAYSSAASSTRASE